MTRRAAALLCGILVALSAPVLAQQASPPDLDGSAQHGAAANAPILPGDQVSIKIFREPELSGVFTVADGGDLVLPRLGRLPVSGRSARSLEDSLVTAYSTYLRSPTIEVVVLRRVSVHGEVRKPDVYMVDLTMTLRDVLARAGGITELGNPASIVLIRDGERLRLGRQESATLATAELRSGDQILVGRRSWLELNALGAISTAAVVVSVMIPVIRSVW